MRGTVCASSLREFQDMEEAWRALSGASAPSLFSTFDLVDLWYRCFAQPDQVRVYSLGGGTESIGYLPMVRRRVLGVRMLAPLVNSHCFHARAVMRSCTEERFPVLAKESFSCDRRGWDVLRQDCSYSFDAIPPLVPEDQKIWKGVAVEPFAEPTYVIRLRKSFDEYMHQDLSKKNRNAISRFKNRLKRAGGFELRVSIESDVVASWPRFVEIEDSGWKGREGSSIRRCGPEISRYYEGLVPLLSKLGAGMLFFLELRGEPIAGAFGYTDGGVFHCWKMGYLDSYAEYAPSIVLLNLMVEWLVESGQDLELLHLFPGDYGYKHRFVNEAATSHAAWVFNGTARGRATRAAWATKRAARRVASWWKERGASEGSAENRDNEEEGA
jgi:CelD/BcsL family acetyltransferase involved in cellulose biosynthesis